MDRRGFVITCVAVATVFFLAVLVLGGTVQEDVVNPFVEVRTDKGLGSGTVVRVGDEVLVLTAGHVVEQAHKDHAHVTLFREVGRRRTEIDAEVVAFSAPEDAEVPGDDLALLKPSDVAGLHPATLGFEHKLYAGEEAWYIGSPAGLHASLEKTIVNKPEHFLKFAKKTQKMFLVNGHAWFGNSGGGVYVRRSCLMPGEDGFVLIGIITRAVSDSPKTPAGCEHPETIKKFINGYLFNKEAE